MAEALKKSSLGELKINSLSVSLNELTAEISDGRVISVPTAWFPRLARANIQQLENFEISPGGYGIHWPDLDEDISIKSFINP